MAKQIQGNIYPWDRWLDGKRRTLKRGTHFQILPHTLRIIAYGAAKRRGIKVTCSVPNEDTLRIQASGR